MWLWRGFGLWHGGTLGIHGDVVGGWCIFARILVDEDKLERVVVVSDGATCLAKKVHFDHKREFMSCNDTKEKGRVLVRFGMNGITEDVHFLIFGTRPPFS